MRTVALLSALALAASVAPSRAYAQTEPPAAADPDDARERSRTAFASGARALEEGRAKEALALFEEAYRLFPHYATFYNIGLCERALGRPVEATAAFQRYLEQGGDEIPAAKVDAIAALLKEAEQKIARVAISASVQGAAVTLDGARVTAGETARVNPGDHVAEATAPGHARATRRFVAPIGGELRVRLDLAPLPTATTGPRLDALFWTTVAVSSGALVAGAVTGGMALADASAYSDPATPDAEAEDHRARGEALRVVADVCFGTAILGGVAAVLLATLRAPAPSRSVAVSARGFALRASF